MKKQILLLCIIGCFAFTAKAQYVTIPDTAFASWLQNNGYVNCLVGNQLDTTCGAVINAHALYCYGVPIRYLSGVEYFKNLDSLICSNDSIQIIPKLPNTLTVLDCGYNKLAGLPSLPTNLKELNCSYNQLTTLPTLPAALTQLYCTNNQLTNLPTLPNSLIFLYTSYNQLTSLPPLPNSLISLVCSNNQLIALPALPNSLSQFYCDQNLLTILPSLPNSITWLSCNYNQLTLLPTLPYSLTQFGCASNQLTAIPTLPSSLTYFSCGHNQLAILPFLPNSLTRLSCGSNQLSILPSMPTLLTQLICDHNQITNLSTLPNSLTYLDCGYNQLAVLPALPNSLNYLSCSDNQLTILPTLPNSLYQLSCDHNQITSMPALPDNVGILNCSYNRGLTCLPLLKTIGNLNFDSTSVTCLPNYGAVAYSHPSLSSLPLCGIYNSSGCAVFWNITGQTYYDQNSNCAFDGNDIQQSNVKILLDSVGSIVQQVYTGGEGYYSFDATYGTYTTRVDTSFLPFNVSCPVSGYRASVISAADSLDYGYDFGLNCRSAGFDLGVTSILNNYTTPRPDATITVNTIAGDIAQLYSAHCAAGVGGTVQLTFSGPITYSSAATGALTPTAISGNTITWNIPDFGNIDIYSAFNILMRVSTSAQAGDPVCITVTVTPNSGTDYRPGNNTLNYCFHIVASLDPNEKEAYPIGNTDTSAHWLTYTVRFQNTGTAEAIHIKVVDTLDANLDPSTFQLLAYSAKNLTQIFGNTVVFNFPNINLPDSTHNEPASHGYVQYKIKLKDNLPLGTQIKNTAYIYFDFNTPVVTNTTVNTIAIDTTHVGLHALNNASADFTVYPNPANNILYINYQGQQPRQLTLYNITGQALHTGAFTNQLNVSHLQQGIYFIEAIIDGSPVRKRFVRN